jgi:hypothetical protein
MQNIKLLSIEECLSISVSRSLNMVLKNSDGQFKFLLITYGDDDDDDDDDDDNNNNKVFVAYILVQSLSLVKLQRFFRPTPQTEVTFGSHDAPRDLGHPDSNE